MDAAFGYCPILVTGGVTVERVDSVISEGAIICGSGFDLTLKDRSPDISTEEIAQIMTEYLEAVKAARKKVYPFLAESESADKQTWLDGLPHHHPF